MKLLKLGLTPGRVGRFPRRPLHHARGYLARGSLRQRKISEKDFDPGAKYHVAANVPYTRYSPSFLLQFRFHRALARTMVCTGPVNRCSIYGNQEAGRGLNAMLEMGLSRP